MAYTWQDKSSFLFGSKDMFTTFGIQISDEGMPNDVLKPQLRERKVTIPLRNGAYDYGSHYYDERPYGINCVTVKAGTRDDAREMAYIHARSSPIHPASPVPHCQSAQAWQLSAVSPSHTRHWGSQRISRGPGPHPSAQVPACLGCHLTTTACFTGGE